MRIWFRTWQLFMDHCMTILSKLWTSLLQVRATCIIRVMQSSRRATTPTSSNSLLHPKEKKGMVGVVTFYLSEPWTRYVFLSPRAEMIRGNGKGSLLPSSFSSSLIGLLAFTISLVFIYRHSILFTSHTVRARWCLSLVNLSWGPLL